MHWQLIQEVNYIKQYNFNGLALNSQDFLMSRHNQELLGRAQCILVLEVYSFNIFK